jgi:hypothetical protein
MVAAACRRLLLTRDDVGDEVLAAALAHMPCLQVDALPASTCITLQLSFTHCAGCCACAASCAILASASHQT